MSDLLKKRDRNSLNTKNSKIEPEHSFDRQRLFSAKERFDKKAIKKDESTGIRIERSVLKDLKALKTMEDSASLSEVIQSMIYVKEKNMTDDQRRQYELIKSILN